MTRNGLPRGPKGQNIKIQQFSSGCVTGGAQALRDGTRKSAAEVLMHFQEIYSISGKTKDAPKVSWNSHGKRRSGDRRVTGHTDASILSYEFPNFC